MERVGIGQLGLTTRVEKVGWGEAGIYKRVQYSGKWLPDFC